MNSAPDIDGDDSDKGRRSIGARRNPNSEDAILAAAEAILLEDGPGRFSIEAVARRARAGKPTIYRWWPSKSALLLAVYARQKPVAIISDTGSVEGDVRQFLTYLLAHWANSPGGQVFRYVIAEAQQDAAAASALRDYSVERRRHTAAIFRRGIDRGELRADIDVDIAAEMLGAIAWHRLLLQRLDPSGAEIAAMTRQFITGLAVSGG